MRPLQQYYLLMVVLRYCQNLSISAQGNIRSIVRQDGVVVESTDYYPYGTPFTTAEADSPINTAQKNSTVCTDSTSTTAKRAGTTPCSEILHIRPQSEKYYGLSPYTCCAGNPVQIDYMLL